METLLFFGEYPDVKAYFTTRMGGISTGENTSLNLGLTTGDTPEHVYTNRRLVKEYGDLSYCIEVLPQQVHGDEIAVIKGKPAVDSHGIHHVGQYDGLITCEKDILLTTSHADCLAVYLYDFEKQCVGLCHAGWRGTQKQIAVKMANKMMETFGATPQTMIAGISPGISLCCFEVGEEVYHAFAENHPYIDEYAERKPSGKYHLDLKGINQRQLQENGIVLCEVSKECTCCNTQKFFSYRGEQGKTGRMCAGIVLL